MEEGRNYKLEMPEMFKLLDKKGIRFYDQLLHLTSSEATVTNGFAILQKRVNYQLDGHIALNSEGTITNHKFPNFAEYVSEKNTIDMPEEESEYLFKLLLLASSYVKKSDKEEIALIKRDDNWVIQFVAKAQAQGIRINSFAEYLKVFRKIDAKFVKIAVKDDVLILSSRLYKFVFIYTGKDKLRVDYRDVSSAIY